jgi:cysteine desulfurase
MPSKSIYLDNSGTTKPDPAVIAAMADIMERDWGNPSSIHEVGRRARVRLEEARRQVANSLDCRAEEIIFTSGGTESDNMAILGVLEHRKTKKPHLITVATEHEAVLDTAHWCQSHGYDVTILPVASDGRVDPSDVKKAIRPATAVISVMYVNNELGTVNDVAEIGRIAHEAGVVFHTDAVQGFGMMPCTVTDLNADLVAVSSHKIYGPKGVGVLYVKQGIRLDPRTHGGAQERHLRTGTENVYSIVGFGKACQLAEDQRDRDSQRIRALRDRLEKEIQETIPDVRINGSREHRAPGILNCSFPGCEGEALLVGLDMEGISVSTGSACTAGSAGASHVLVALGLDEEVAQASLRFSFGRNNEPQDVDGVMEVLPRLVHRLREMSPVLG